MAIVQQIAAWQRIWREGFAPQFSSRGLESLRRALKNDDPRLMQGAATDPPPLEVAKDEPVERACAVSYCGWQANGLLTAEQVEEFFWRACNDAVERTGDPDAAREFLNWFDGCLRREVFPQLLQEVEHELALRKRETPKAA